MRHERKQHDRLMRSRQWLSRSETSIHHEVDYITRRAQEHDARVVTLDALVFFSTNTGDAWLLDPEDSYALCLAREGVRQSVSITETEERFAIAWDRTYQFDGERFVTMDQSGQVTAVAGYPIGEIVRALEQGL